MSASVRKKKKSKKRGKNGNGSSRRRKSNRTATQSGTWKPPTGKELKELQKDWDHVT